MDNWDTSSRERMPRVLEPPVTIEGGKRVPVTEGKIPDAGR